ncbi:hypothetical protein ISN44_As06g015090 [Arabidopsis suecica]|uniref:Uncharacterized protein n=1 Tax=Arabidopsis suecica TaxID=45249 RepID=A0A8T2CCN8_ARASU|nr:hypothetical protein ISN44_As06g015090 [Arabidopsis suecica]
MSPPCPAPTSSHPPAISAYPAITPLTPLIGLYLGSQAHSQMNLIGEHRKGTPLASFSVQVFLQKDSLLAVAASPKLA